MQCASVVHGCLRLFSCVISFALVACGTLPGKPESVSDAPRSAAPPTSLGRIAADSLTPGFSSGFRLLPLASHALDARLQLIARAEHSLDVQYYYIAADATGQAFLQALSDAAARGVQVRLLVDDLLTAKLDPMLAQLASESNVDVRLFNPFCCARTGLVSRFVASAGEIRRLNHRMHNKLMIADDAIAIAGGRNIADEYFANNPREEFVDLDAIAAGAVVGQLATIFARYWDSEPAWPAKAILGRGGKAAKAAAIQRGQAALPQIADIDALGQVAPGIELERGRLVLVAGTAYAFADAPYKVLLDDEEYLNASSATSRVREAMAGAQHELVVATPYLIPRVKGMNLIRHLAGNGVRLSILTNSMAANDSLIAHAAYARYRLDMLREGVELHELSPARAGAPRPLLGRMGSVRSLGRLHTKAAVIDRTTLYIGSVNLDPRSADKNTELGIWIDSPELAHQLLTVLEGNRRLGAYRVRLRPGTEALEWVASDDGGGESVLKVEPESTGLMRLHNLLLAPLVPEDLL
jgi:putative cardiolipin synthase